MYVSNKYGVQDAYKKLLTEQLYTSVDFLDFGASEAAADTINSWHAEKFSNLSQNLISAQTLNNETCTLLVNTVNTDMQIGNHTIVYHTFANLRNSENATTKINEGAVTCNCIPPNFPVDQPLEPDTHGTELLNSFADEWSGSRYQGTQCNGEKSRDENNRSFN
ncbi:hypothetical protein EVAR_74000_1 [Eumeta japonica]|uniref:Serpin domain-containing protein n=1 Tax=Eumeta variegata TaxID=151549 RepID=A0A4C1SYW3_EUMVA|nr:hypothetical protein EVAR_74000_1 [Eumeta japonica]